MAETQTQTPTIQQPDDEQTDQKIQNDNDITYFAMTNFRNRRTRFGIKRDDRRKHMYIIGKTGMGKSTMMENMIIQDIQNGEGCAVVDPHGDLVEKIVRNIPTHRINDVVYFNPADLEWPVAFNILENVDPNYKHLVASGLMAIFTKIWANVWSARMEYILLNSILALLESPGSTLLGINRLLVDKKFRKKIVDAVTDPVVKSFWVDEYANYNERFRTEAIAPIQNKVGQFLSSSIVRNIVGQSKSTIDPRDIMDSGKILLMNLAKGRIGEDNSSLLGAMMITKLQLAAMSRIDIPEEARKDYYLYVDEFQNFATESFASILSEARKYHLDLIMGHQYIEQLEEEVASAVFGNVGTMVVFRVGAADAEELVKEFTPYFVEDDLVNLSKYDMYLKLMIDGVASRPFSSVGLPPITEAEGVVNLEKVIEQSRERYSKTREKVEEQIIKWSGLESMFQASAEGVAVLEEEAIYSDKGKQSSRQIEEKPLPPQSEPQREPPAPARNDDNKHTAICDNCRKETKISFVPDEKRNIFCKDCLVKFKNREINAGSLPKRNVARQERRAELVKPGQAAVPQFNRAERQVASKILSPTEALEKELSAREQAVPASIPLSAALAAKPQAFKQKSAIVRPSSPKPAPDSGSSVSSIGPGQVVELNQ